MFIGVFVAFAYKPNFVLRRRAGAIAICLGLRLLSTSSPLLGLHQVGFSSPDSYLSEL